VVEQQILRALVEFADPLAADAATGAYLDRLCTRCTQLFRLDAALVHLPGERAALRLAAAARPGLRLGGWLEELEAGPIAESFRTGRPVHLTDPASRRTRTWAAALGVAAKEATLVAVPLRRGTQRTGVLTLVRGYLPPLVADEVEAAAALAEVAAGTLAAGRALGEARTVAGQLQHALDSRVLIEQAKGVLAARDSLDVEQAFERLRRYARNHHRNIRDVAREVVEGRLHLTS
jgi:hypothetical protein